MRATARFELPPERQALFRRAVRLEWMTILFFASAVALLYLTLGSSQAMKAAWVEDILAFVPPAAFLIAARVRDRAPTERYPYGYHRAVSIGYLWASLALLVLGVLILWDSVTKLIRLEHPPIGLVEPFGQPVWLGWLMIAALAYTVGPAVILGRMKLPLARALRDKILYADAEMNRADWMTATAAILGIVGIYFGLWWADGVAASVISVDIVRDGLRNTREAMALLMDKHPTVVDASRSDPLPARVRTALLALPWVKDAAVRFREEGHVMYGDILVVPKDDRRLVQRLEEAGEYVRGLDWKIHDVVIMPVRSLEEAGELGEERPAG